jgi:hypothetical protein
MFGTVNRSDRSVRFCYISVLCDSFCKIKLSLWLLIYNYRYCQFVCINSKQNKRKQLFSSLLNLVILFTASGLEEVVFRRWVDWPASLTELNLLRVGTFIWGLIEVGEQCLFQLPYLNPPKCFTPQQCSLKRRTFCVSLRRTRLATREQF